MTKRCISVVATGLVVLCLASTPTQARVSRADRTFVTKALQGGIAEIQMAQLAAQLGVDSGVRDFADRMIKDHSAANWKLKQIARSEGIPVPSRADQSHRIALNKMSHLSGEAFDLAYAKTQVREHGAAIRLFKSEANGGGNEQIREFAASTLPTLQMHHKMTYQVEAALEPTPSRLAHRRHH